MSPVLKSVASVPIERATSLSGSLLARIVLVFVRLRARSVVPFISVGALNRIASLSSTISIRIHRVSVPSRSVDAVLAHVSTILLECTAIYRDTRYRILISIENSIDSLRLELPRAYRFSQIFFSSPREKESIRWNSVVVLPRFHAIWSCWWSTRLVLPRD